MKQLKIAVLCLASLCAGPLAAASPAPDDARAYIVSPAHGEVVGTRFKVIFGLAGIGVAPAGVDPKPRIAFAGWLSRNAGLSSCRTAAIVAESARSDRNTLMATSPPVLVSRAR